MSGEIFSDKERVKFDKELEDVRKIIPESPTIDLIREAIKKGKPLPFNEVPKLHNDKEAILYANLIQPNCPDAAFNFKLKNYLSVFIETSCIHAQNALRRENVEFKGFWSSVTCFIITLLNFQTNMLIPIMIYEYGFGFFKWLVISYIFICFPILVFVISLSQYSGLDSSRVYSRIKKVWRGMEYVVLLRTFYSIILIMQEIQYASGNIEMIDFIRTTKKNYLESCLSTDDGCVNLGFIHPCSTGYSDDIPDNKHCREINQVSLEKYVDSKPVIKTISTAQHISYMFQKPIYKKDIKFSLIIPGLIIFLITIFLYFGKAKCVAIVALFSLPIIAGKLYVLLLLSVIDWRMEFEQFMNIEFVPSFTISITIVNLSIRSLNIIDMVPKISASLPSQLKAVHISFLIIISNIILIIISTSLYIGSSIYYKQLIMKNSGDYGRIPKYVLSNMIPYLTLTEQFIVNNKQFENILVIICTLIHRCFILSIYFEIFYDYAKTGSMKFYTLFGNYNFLSKITVVISFYLTGLFILESTSYSIFNSPFVILFQKIDATLLFIQFNIIAYIYGINKYLTHIREMTGRVQIRDNVLKMFKFVGPVLFAIFLMTSGDNNEYNYYKDLNFHHYMIITTLQTKPTFIILVVVTPIIFFIIVEVIKSSIDGLYWKAVFRSMDFWGKRENKFIKVSSLHND